MHVLSLKINNLRNISAADILPHPGLNILHGENGAGKTSVLESLVVLAKGRSFRSGQVVSLVGPESDAFQIVATLGGDDRVEHRLGLERTASHWKARIDGEDAEQLSELAPLLPLVLLEPNSHALVTGSPDIRRRFLDWGVFHVKHDYLVTWRRFNRALKQRNAALRQRQANVVKSIDPQLVQLAGEIEAVRTAQLSELNRLFQGLIKELSPELGDLSAQYDPGWRGESYAEALQRLKDRDLERGATQAGPHRADIVIQHGAKLARDRLSRGEQKIVAAGLLLSEAQMMKQAGASPALLLDDLASEFDEVHLENVLGTALAMDSQLWVTGTSAAPYLESCGQEHALFHVKQGQIDKRQD